MHAALPYLCPSNYPTLATPLAEALFTSDMTKLCHWLCMFMKEARHSRILMQLLSGIQRFSSSKIYTTPESAYIPDSGVVIPYMPYICSPVMTSSSWYNQLDTLCWHGKSKYIACTHDGT